MDRVSLQAYLEESRANAIALLDVERNKFYSDQISRERFTELSEKKRAILLSELDDLEASLSASVEALSGLVEDLGGRPGDEIKQIVKVLRGAEEAGRVEDGRS